MRLPIGTNEALRHDCLGCESSQHSTLSNLPERLQNLKQQFFISEPMLTALNP